jgi:hypothetical protein
VELRRLAHKLKGTVTSYGFPDITRPRSPASFHPLADHETQERVWNNLPEWDRDNPGIVRRILLKEEIPPPINASASSVSTPMNKPEALSRAICSPKAKMAPPSPIQNYSTAS